MKTKLQLLCALLVAVVGPASAQRQNINVGSTANDGTGDNLRAAGIKINANFVELYGGGYLVAMPALEMNMTADNTKTLSANATITFGTAPTKTLQPSSLSVVNTHTSAITVTLPANVVDASNGTTVSSFEVAAASGGNNGLRTVLFRWRSGTTYEIFQGGSGAANWSALTGRPDILVDIGDLPDPGADRLGFWDNSAGTFTWLTPSLGLSISDDVLTAPGYQQYGTFTGTGSYAAGTVYFGTLDEAATVTLDLDAGETTGFVLNVTDAPHVLTGPAAYRTGYTGGTTTTLTFRENGRHRVEYTSDGTNITVTDSIYEPPATILGDSTTGIATNPYTLDPGDAYSFILFVEPAADGVVNLPTGVAGMNGIVYNLTANEVDVNPTGSQSIKREGTVQANGVSVQLSAGDGNFLAILFDGVRWVTLGFKGTISEGS